MEVVPHAKVDYCLVIPYWSFSEASQLYILKIKKNPGTTIFILSRILFKRSLNKYSQFSVASDIFVLNREWTNLCLIGSLKIYTVLFQLSSLFFYITYFTIFLQPSAALVAYSKTLNLQFYYIVCKIKEAYRVQNCILVLHL